MNKSSLYSIWAKSPQENSKQGESLVEHTEKVVNSLISFIEVKPDLPKSLDFPELWH